MEVLTAGLLQQSYLTRRGRCLPVRCQKACFAFFPTNKEKTALLCLEGQQVCPGRLCQPALQEGKWQERSQLPLLAWHCQHRWDEKELLVGRCLLAALLRLFGRWETSQHQLQHSHAWQGLWVLGKAEAECPDRAGRPKACTTCSVTSPLQLQATCFPLCKCTQWNTTWKKVFHSANGMKILSHGRVNKLQRTKCRF